MSVSERRFYVVQFYLPLALSAFRAVMVIGEHSSDLAKLVIGKR